MEREPKFFTVREFESMMETSATVYDNWDDAPFICLDWLNYAEYLPDWGKSYPLSMSVVY